MTEKMTELMKRYEELLERISLSETYTDIAAYTALEKELREITPIAETYKKILEINDELDMNQELLEDPDFRELAKEEIKLLRSKKEQYEEELTLLMLPKDPNDEKNVIMEIRGGVGGEEGMLFARDLYRMYTMYAAQKKWNVQIVNVSETELGGIKEISLIIEGNGAYSRLKYEAGGHRVQRVPATEAGGRIHTSAATVAVLPEIDDVEFELNLNDIKIDTYRSSGAGGQHVNKTESAIRLTHLPTGTVVECQDERSQYKNKDRAFQIMRSKLYDMELRKQQQQVAAERKMQVGSGDRSDRVRTYNFPQNRVTDHRLSGDNRSFNIASIMDGNLDPIIDQLSFQDRAEKLKSEGKINEN